MLAAHVDIPSVSAKQKPALARQMNRSHAAWEQMSQYFPYIPMRFDSIGGPTNTNQTSGGFPDEQDRYSGAVRGVVAVRRCGPCAIAGPGHRCPGIGRV